jgi:hypothetical protein
MVCGFAQGDVQANSTYIEWSRASLDGRVAHLRLLLDRRQRGYAALVTHNYD